MKRIALFAGTTEGRRIAEYAAASGIHMDVYCATEYGTSLMPASEYLHPFSGRRDASMIREALRSRETGLCVDATHPYARVITQTLRDVCDREGIRCLRVTRGSCADEYRDAEIFEDAGKAAEYLAGREGKILLTIGSKDLAAFSTPESLRSRCMVRVLPTSSVLQSCEKMGFAASQIAAMQGPFSEEFNELLLRETGAAFLVTKDSGTEGGCPEKIRAASRLGVRVILIGRPGEPDPGIGLSEAMRQIGEYAEQEGTVPADGGSRPGGQAVRKVYLIGMGPGDPAYLTMEARKAIRDADALLGSGRMLQAAGRLYDEEWPKDRRPAMYASSYAEEVLRIWRGHPEIRNAAILYSGDISCYSGARRMEELISGEADPVKVPGISSVSLFLMRCGCAAEDTELLSLHGRETDLIPYIRRSRKLLVLLGREDSLRQAARALEEWELGSVRITVGEKLTYPDERMRTGYARDFISVRTSPLALALFENPAPEEPFGGFGLEDTRFARGRVPMTKREVRMLCLSEMSLREDSVVWDVGAGTGSVSVEAALRCSAGKVYAVERDPEAVALIMENRRKFRCSNLHIINGEAPEALSELPKPDAVFVGGSGGSLRRITEVVFSANRDAVLVIAAVTDETAAEITVLRREFEENGLSCKMTELMAVRHERVGAVHLRRAGNPVLVARFGRSADEQPGTVSYYKGK